MQLSAILYAESWCHDICLFFHQSHLYCEEDGRKGARGHLVPYFTLWEEAYKMVGLAGGGVTMWRGIECSSVYREVVS